MKLRLTVVATALSVLTVSPVYAGGADGGCDYASKFKYTSAEPQEPSEAAKKLASLSLPAAGQETTADTAASAGATQDAEKTTSQ